MDKKLTNDEYWQLYEATEKSCDKNCASCPIYSEQYKMCNHKVEELWKQQSVEKHREFAKFLKEYKGWTIVKLKQLWQRFIDWLYYDEETETEIDNRIADIQALASAQRIQYKKGFISEEEYIESINSYDKQLQMLEKEYCDE